MYLGTDIKSMYVQDKKDVSQQEPQLIAIKVGLQEGERSDSKKREGSSSPTNTKSNNHVSYEPGQTKKDSHAYRMKREAVIIKRLQGQEGVPKLYWFGMVPQFKGTQAPIGSHVKMDRKMTALLKPKTRYVMVTQYLSKTLGQLASQRKDGLTSHEMFKVVNDMLYVIEGVHSKGFLHRDLKPDNIMVGKHPNKDQQQLYLIDYGLSRKYTMSDGKHIPYSSFRSFAGTPRYASIQAHMVGEQGRRDDLESMMYVMIFLAKGSLPWQGMRAKNHKDRMERIFHRKLYIGYKKMTEGLDRGLARAFQKALENIKMLSFADKPNYRNLRMLFREEGKNIGVNYTKPLHFKECE